MSDFAKLFEQLITGMTRRGAPAEVMFRSTIARALQFAQTVFADQEGAAT